MEASACVDASGFIWLMNGHSANAAPTPWERGETLAEYLRRITGGNWP